MMEHRLARWASTMPVGVTHARLRPCSPLVRRVGLLVAGMLAVVVFVAVPVGPASAAPPSNDNFPGATITGTSGSIAGTTVEATPESGEPNVSGYFPEAVWYSWTAPATATASFELDPCGYACFFFVWTGTSVDSLTGVWSGSPPSPPVEFPVTAGTVYRIQVEGYDAATGTFTLNWNLVGDTTDPTVDLATPPDGRSTPATRA